MRCDFATYVITSIAIFSAAFAISLKSFINSDLSRSVKECYAASLDMEDMWPFDHQQDIQRSQLQPAITCTGYVSAFFTFVESQKLSLLVSLSVWGGVESVQVDINWLLLRRLI